jgi:xanthine dehydrogenase YagR molybdenum-binding subunit
MMDGERGYWNEGPLPETPTPSSTPQPWDETTIVGDRKPRVDGYERVSGSAVYPSDVNLPDTLYGAILRCPHAHAKVRSIDVSAARKLPGVRAVLTSSSAEVQDLTWSYRGTSVPLLDPVCRHEGEAVAAVAAETSQQAVDALRTISVDYEILPFVADETKALDDNAPQIHEGGNRVGEPSSSERGDVAKGFEEADVVLSKSFTTACELHTPLERHGCAAKWDGDRLTIWESTQGVYRVQSMVAGVLGMPLANVRVIGHYMGGGFGSKLQADKYSVLAALLAKVTARPVKLFITREETFLCVGNRPPSNLKLKAGARSDGTLTALEYTALCTGGAYPAGGTSLIDFLIRDLYTCPNIRTEATDVYINAGPARPFRAPGHPECAWALEQMMDELARELGMDPVQLRLKNLPKVSQARGNQPYTSTGLRECLVEGAKEFGWDTARSQRPDEGHLRRGVGVAACEWVAGGGGPPSTIIVKLFSDGSVNLNMGASDIGTGTKSWAAMIVTEELGVPLEEIQIEHADTGTTQFATPSGGSKTVPTESPAVRAAAWEVRRQLFAIASDELGVAADDLELADGTVRSRSNPDTGKPIRQLEGFQRRGVILGVGYRGPNPEGKIVNPFAAQFCEVEVNTRTGEIRVLRFVGAHESGRVLNRLTFDSQVIGGIAMGIGLGLTEERILDRKQTGKLVNRSWHDYKLPTAMDVPADIGSIAIEPDDDEANLTGAKGLGEPVTIPTAAALANAVYDAIGVRLTSTPMTPARVLDALANQKEA